MSKQQRKEKKSFKASLKRMFGGRFRAGSYSAVAAAVDAADKIQCIFDRTVPSGPFGL